MNLDLVQIVLYVVSAAVGYWLRTRQEGPFSGILNKLLADEDKNGKLDILERLVGNARPAQQAPPAAPAPAQPTSTLGR